MVRSNKINRYRMFFVTVFFAHIVMNANMTMRMVDVAGNHFLEFVLKAGILVFNALFVYDVLHFVALRPCCEVIVSYIRHKRDTLWVMLATTGNAAIAKLSGADENSDLQLVRINLRSVAELKKVLNDVWRYSIVASATVVLVITCICTYCLFDDGVPMEQLLLTMTYCFYLAVDFTDIARLSQTMSNELSDLCLHQM
ncbi:hypothetical protein HPB50_010456 [Hyalomma asiaticum]|uniref:Uncharacterized protein n=1 Tax=Hyalomma asiaticum TaxID=266040 RepID=A0ACB7RRJ4_HYAAI|nr:hypothetical protein HPB50_010456 [Hyalomma asiaticum]